MPRAPGLRKSKLNVAAGILYDSMGRVLITDRTRASSMQEYWEFPGGKIRPGESAADALCRELDEELGIRILSLEPFHSLRHEYPETSVEIEFFLVNEWEGMPSGVEGQALRWLHPDEMSPETVLPADKPVLELLISRC